MMTDQKLASYRAAIIGCGSIANSHASGYNRVETTTLVACADTVEAKAQSFAERNGIPNHYADYRQMLEVEQPDIVSVCTWHPLHAEMTIAAAARQPKAILCEKPMATNLGEAEAMMIACQRNQVKLAIGFQRRFLGAWTKAKELIAAGAIGEASTGIAHPSDRIAQRHQPRARLYALHSGRSQSGVGLWSGGAED